MKSRILGVAALAPLVLAACGTPPRKPDLTLPAAYQAPAAPAPADAIALDQWWTAFGDPELTVLIQTALDRSPDARSAAARLEEARATRRGTLWDVYLPDGALDGSARRTETKLIDGTQLEIPGFANSGVSKSYGLNFDVSYELDFFGARRAARQVADADYAAARFNYEVTRASLAANVAQSYFEARGLAIQLEDARQTARLQNDLYQVASKRAAAGLAPSSEADQSAASLAQSNAQAANLEAELQAAKRTLLILAGRGIDPVESLPAPAAVPVAPPVPTSVPGELLERRPEIREAEARLRAAAGTLRGSEVALFPRFTLTPGIGLTRNEQPGFSSTTRAWYLGGTLMQPILDIPQLLAQEKATRARAEQAVVAYEKAVQDAYGEAENTLVRLAADHRRVDLLTAGEARARKAYDAARKRYDMGFDDLTAAVTAETNWRAARTALTGAQVQSLTRTVQAYKALGGGWTPLDQKAASAAKTPVKEPQA
ncbi:efflux transporter outer membrane subunit [Caulobacter sp. NIBR2454]|uniref:efflux transporter outer membrane subunit n=1 Tax=Caulobacter sp. NIBR2454 TaxID=3015996 RepID=UPI0022B5E8AC|nr:TolC family protein [Caulobacter sp. NIBR2454]